MTCSHYTNNQQEISTQYRDRRSLFFFSVFHILCAANVIASDRVPNPDVVAMQTGGKVGQIPTDNGQVSMTISSPHIPNVKVDMQPNLPNQQQSTGSSNVGGLLGFLFNFGKPSRKESHMEEVRNGIDKALSKAQAGIPLNSEDYSALGAADLSKPLLKTEVPIIIQPEPAKQLGNAFESQISSGVVLASTPVPVSTYVGTSIPVGKGGITCLPQLPDGSGSFSGTVLMPQNSTSTILPEGAKPTMLSESPFKGLNDPQPGNSAGIGGVVTVIAGAGAMTSQTATVPAATTVTVGAGGTATATTTTTTVGGALAAAAPWVAVVGSGVIIGLGLAMLHDGIFNPGIGWFPSYEERQAYHARRAALKAGKAPSAIPQHKASNNLTMPSGNPNPKKPEDDKKERNRTLEKTRYLTNKEARALVKDKLPGYEEKSNPPFETHGSTAFYNSKTKTWISPDRDCHNGGVWKLFNKSGNQRLGTYDTLLKIRIKD